MAAFGENTRRVNQTLHRWGLNSKEMFQWEHELSILYSVSGFQTFFAVAHTNDILEPKPKCHKVMKVVPWYLFCSVLLYLQMLVETRYSDFTAQCTWIVASRLRNAALR